MAPKGASTVLLEPDDDSSQRRPRQKHDRRPDGVVQAPLRHGSPRGRRAHERVHPCQTCDTTRELRSRRPKRTTSKVGQLGPVGLGQGRIQPAFDAPLSPLYPRHSPGERLQQLPDGAGLVVIFIGVLRREPGEEEDARCLVQKLADTDGLPIVKARRAVQERRAPSGRVLNKLQQLQAGALDEQDALLGKEVALGRRSPRSAKPAPALPALDFHIFLPSFRTPLLPPAEVRRGPAVGVGSNRCAAVLRLQSSLTAHGGGDGRGVDGGQVVLQFLGASDGLAHVADGTEDDICCFRVCCRGHLHVGRRQAGGVDGGQDAAVAGGQDGTLDLEQLRDGFIQKALLGLWRRRLWPVRRALLLFDGEAPSVCQQVVQRRHDVDVAAVALGS
eukprot:scaffold4850_cov213-Pinguiococcus_pyrenoidosus.AAC.9